MSASIGLFGVWIKAPFCNPHHLRNTNACMERRRRLPSHSARAVKEPLPPVHHLADYVTDSRQTEI